MRRLVNDSLEGRSYLTLEGMIQSLYLTGSRMRRVTRKVNICSQRRPSVMTADWKAC